MEGNVAFIRRNVFVSQRGGGGGSEKEEEEVVHKETDFYEVKYSCVIKSGRKMLIQANILNIVMTFRSESMKEN